MPDFETLRVRIVGDSDLKKTFAEGEKSAKSFDTTLGKVFKKYGDRTIHVDVEEDGSEKVSKSLGVLDKNLKSVSTSSDKSRDSLGRFTSGSKSANSEVVNLTGGIKNLASEIRSTGTVLAAAAIPFAIAGIGAGIPTIAALGASFAGLALNLGKAAAGFGLVAGVAGGGALAGLRAYTALISSTVTASKEAFDATHEHAVALAEQRRQTTLNTEASKKFNFELLDMQQGFAELQAAVGNRVFPLFTREMHAWGGVLASNKNEIADTAGEVAGVAVGFTRWFRTADDGKVLGQTLSFINSSAVKGAKFLSAAGKAGVGAIRPLIPMASDLQDEVLGIANKTQKWVNSAEGTKKLTAIYHDLWKETERTGRSLLDVGKGIFNVFDSIDSAGLADQASRGLGTIASGLEKVTRKGTESRSKLDAFMDDTRRLMPFAGAAVMSFVRQIGHVAGELIDARQEGHKLTILQEIFRGIEKAARPLGRLLIGTFKGLGPEIARLVPNFARLAETFAGSSGPLITFVRGLNRALEVFNKLPGPVKTTVANLVALKVILGGLGFGAVAGALGRFASTSFLASRATKKLAPALVAEGVAAKGASFSVRGLSASLKGAAVSAAAFLTIGTGGTFLVVAAALAGIAAAAYVVYRNWGRITKALKPATEGFKSAWAVIKPFAQQLGGQLVKSLKALASGLLHAIIPGKTFAKQVHNLADEVGDFARRAAPPIIRALKDMSHWLEENQPAIKAVGRLLGGVLVSAAKNAWRVMTVGVRVFKGIVGAIQAVFKIKKAWTNFWTDMGEALGKRIKAMREALEKWRTGAVTWVKSLPSKIGNAWHKFWQGVQDWLTKKKDAMLGALGNWMSKAVSWVKSLPSKIGNAWHSFWQDTQDWLTKKKDAMLGTLDNWRDKAVSWVKSLPSKIGKLWKSFWQGMADWVVEKKDGILNTMSKLVSGVKSAWNSLLKFIDKVLKAVGIGGDSGNSGGSGGGNSGSGGGGGGGGGGGAFAQGGLAGFAKGGLSDPHSPKMHMWGEGAYPEGYVTTDPKYRKQNLGYLAQIADRLGQRVEPKNAYGAGGAHAPNSGHRSIGMAHATGAWYPKTAAVNAEIERDFHVQGSTYPGHGADGDAKNSVDWMTGQGWGRKATGKYLAKGNQILDRILSQHKSFTDYWIWQGKMGDSGGVHPYRGGGGYANPAPGDVSGNHLDHVHWESLEHNAGPSVGGGGTGGAGGGGMSLWESVGSALWDRTVQPLVDRFVKSMQGGFVLRQAAGALTSNTADTIKEWIISNSGGGGGIGGGDSPKGLTLLEGATQAGWGSNAKHAAAIAWRESGGNASAAPHELGGTGPYNKDSNYARGDPSIGLMQIIGSYAAQVLHTSKKNAQQRLMDPITNYKVGKQLHGEQGWGPWATAAGWREGLGHINEKITGYARGGISQGGRLPRATEQAFLVVARALGAYAGHTVKTERGSGQVTSGITAIAGEAGTEAIVPRNRTPEGAAALREANSWYGMPAYRRGGINLIGNDGKLTFHGSGANDAIRAGKKFWGRTGVQFGHGGDVRAVYRAGRAAGTTSSTGLMRVDPQFRRSAVGDEIWGHEAGHAMTLGHSRGLMSPVVRNGLRPSSADLRYIKRHFGHDGAGRPRHRGGGGGGRGPHGSGGRGSGGRHHGGGHETGGGSRKHHKKDQGYDWDFARGHFDKGGVRYLRGGRRPIGVLGGSGGGRHKGPRHGGGGMPNVHPHRRGASPLSGSGAGGTSWDLEGIWARIERHLRNMDENGVDFRDVQTLLEMALRVQDSPAGEKASERRHKKRLRRARARLR